MPDVVQKVITANDVKNGNAVVGVDKQGNNHVLSPTLNKVPILGQVETKYTNDFTTFDTVEYIGVDMVGDNVNIKEVLASVSNRKIQVTSYVLTPEENGHIAWYSDTNGLASGVYVSSSGTMSANSDLGLFETNVGENLGLFASPSGNTVTGHLSYKLV